MSSPTRVWEAANATTTYGQNYVRCQIAAGALAALQDGDYLTAMLYHGAEEPTPPAGWELVSRLRISPGDPSETRLSLYGHQVCLPEPDYSEWSDAAVSIMAGVGYRGTHAADPVEAISFGSGTADTGDFTSPGVTVASADTLGAYWLLVINNPSVIGLSGWDAAVTAFRNVGAGFQLNLTASQRAFAAPGAIGPLSLTMDPPGGFYANAMMALASGEPPPPPTRHKGGSIVLL